MLYAGAALGGAVASSAGAKLARSSCTRVVSGMRPPYTASCQVRTSASREFTAGGRQAAARQRHALAFGGRFAHRRGVGMRQPRQHPPIQQRQRAARVAAIPQRPRGGADVGGQALRADVQLAHRCGRQRRPLAFGEDAGRAASAAGRSRCRPPATPASTHTMKRPDWPIHLNRPKTHRNQPGAPAFLQVRRWHASAAVDGALGPEVRIFTQCLPRGRDLLELWQALPVARAGPGARPAARRRAAAPPTQIARAQDANARRSSCSTSQASSSARRLRYMANPAAT